MGFLALPVCIFFSLLVYRFSIRIRRLMTNMRMRISYSESVPMCISVDPYSYSATHPACHLLDSPKE